MISPRHRVRWALVLVMMLNLPQTIAWLAPHTVSPSRCYPYGWRRQCSMDSSSLRPSPASTSGAATAASSAADPGISTAPPPRNGEPTEAEPLPQSPLPLTPSASSSPASSSPISWQHARFSVTLPPPRGSGDRSRAVTKAVTNGLTPLLEGFPAGEGVGLLQVLNCTASLAVSPSVTSPQSETERAANPAAAAAVALTLRDGNAVWPEGQELWLTLAESDSAGSISSVTDLEVRPPSDLDDQIARDGNRGGGVLPEGTEQRGSSRYDFSVLWSLPAGENDRGEHPSGDVGMKSEKLATAPSDDADTGGVSGSEDGRGAAVGGIRASGGNGRGMGPSGGHVVGELRPLNEFSAARQEALDQALQTVGVDPRELTEADEFFGTAALKSYNTFVRPRPKQLAKVMQEPVSRAALRTAHQVAFLVRRHRADRAEYLRNKDASMTEAERQGLVAHPVVLVCDNVRSAYNVGSIFRSADTARAAEVISCGFTPHPGGHGEDKVRKTAFGSIDAVNHRHFEDPAEAIRSLKAQGAFVCALETTEGASSLFDVRFPLPPSPSRNGTPRQSNATRDAVETRGKDGGLRDSATAAETGGGEGGTGQEHGEGMAGRPVRGGEEGEVLDEGGVVALVLGNEVTGVDERVLNLCDLVVEVPVFGLKNSLNVASAGTVVLYEVLRQWSLAGRLAGGGD